MNGLLAEDPAYFLVGVTIRPVNIIKVYIDADTGVGIDRCVRYNRRLYQQIVETGLFADGECSLEVSSPGIDEPLRMHRQYVKNIGRQVEVTKTDETIVKGLMKGVTEADITVIEEKGKGRKKEVVEHLIPFTNIKIAKIQIVF